MGSCLSKKNESSTALNVSLPVTKPLAVAAGPPPPDPKPHVNVAKVEKKNVVKEREEEEEEKEGKKKKQAEGGEGGLGLVKKEVFVIKHRRSHERERDVSPMGSNNSNSNNGSVAAAEAPNTGAVVRTSSCTKEEVDAILIQCGRLSRSNSSGKRKYSGSKRSYDFDQNDQSLEASGEYGRLKDDDGGDDDDGGGGETRRDRSRHRESSRQQRSGSAQGRRRTPSREREQRSGSRERGSGRRVSRSPGRRSETNSSANVGNGANSSSNRPGKMVSVPATVSSSAMDKSSNGVETAAIKRISVKRNVGEGGATRIAASPRSISPTRANARAAVESSNQQQPSLSRNSSRKAEQSPCRRNPLAEIDPNSLVYPQAVGSKVNTSHVSSCNKVQPRSKEMEGLALAKDSILVQNQKPTAEISNRIIAKESNSKGNPDRAKLVKEQQQIEKAAHVTASMPPGDESSRPQTITRSRSARRSRDLDINPEAPSNHSPSYTTLLLEDIQNFHQKNVPAFSLPPCLSKACSILEAVADLNSTTSSNLPCALSEDRRSAPVVSNNLAGKKLSETKDPFVESEIQATDDLMEPSFHKYVTLRRGTMPAEDMDGQESSGSNSFVGGSSQQQQWGNSTSSWEPSSADSTDRWTSRSNTTREESEWRNQVGSQRDRRTLESGSHMEENRRGFSGQRMGNGRGRLGAGKNLQSVPLAAAAAST